MNITRDRDIPDVQKVYVNDTEVQKGQNTFVDISLFAIEDDTYVATVNRHDPVNITIMPKGAMSTVTLWGDTIETPVSKYRGGVFENVAQNESGTTNFEFRVDAADGKASKTYKLQILYAGDDDTDLESVSFKGIEAGKISPNSDDYYTDADGTQKQYKAKYIVNLVNEKEYYGDIVIKGVNEYQGITLYDEDGSTVIANSTSGILTRFYTMRKNVVNLPFTVTSHNIDNEFVTEHYILTLTRRMPELEEVRADDNLLIYNKIQYTYQALPNAKKVKVYVKANDKDAKVQIGDFDWALYEDEQDYDISKAGETTFTVPLNISVYPYTEYTTRNLVITKGDSKLKQISVSVKDNDEAVSRRIAANDYGEYVAVIPEENTSEYVTVSLNAPSDGYVLEL